jgi:hypothetical protein
VDPASSLELKRVLSKNDEGVLITEGKRIQNERGNKSA